MSKKYRKRFAEWIEKKQQLEAISSTPKFVREGEFWWCSLGENIGVEISGKGRKFCRPVVIVKKFGPHSFLGVPATTNSNRKGNWYVHFKHKNVLEIGMLNQVRILSAKRLDERIGRLNSSDFIKVKEALSRLFGNESPR